MSRSQTRAVRRSGNKTPQPLRVALRTRRSRPLLHVPKRSMRLAEAFMQYHADAGDQVTAWEARRAVQMAEEVADRRLLADVQLVLADWISVTPQWLQAARLLQAAEAISLKAAPIGYCCGACRRSMRCRPSGTVKRSPSRARLNGRLNDGQRTIQERRVPPSRWRRMPSENAGKPTSRCTRRSKSSTTTGRHGRV